MARIKYEAICLGEIKGASDYLMVDLSNFELCTMTKLIKSVLAGYSGKNAKVAMSDGIDGIEEVCFNNFSFSLKTLYGHFTDGIPESMHYKITYTGNSTFKFDSQDVYMLGMVSDQYMVFIPGRTDKYNNCNMDDPKTALLMFYGFKNVYKQAGMIAVLDKEIAVGLKKKVKLKYINASPGTKDGIDVFKGKDIQNIFDRLIRKDYPDRHGLALWMIQIVRSSIVSSLEIDPRGRKEKEQLYVYLNTVYNSLMECPDKNVEDEIIHMFNSTMPDKSLFKYENVADIPNRIRKRAERVLADQARRREVEMQQERDRNTPVENIKQLAESMESGIQGGFSASGFRVKAMKSTETRSCVTLNIAVIKRGIDKAAKVEISKLGDKYQVTFSFEMHPGINYINTLEIPQNEALKSEIYFKGISGTSLMASELHKALFEV